MGAADVVDAAEGGVMTEETFYRLMAVFVVGGVGGIVGAYLSELWYRWRNR